MSDDDGSRTRRGAETRARILETALGLFLERGYQETTMRLVAREAGVSVGNAYYYFASKEVLVQAFYRRTHEEHLAACAEVLPRKRSFEGRLKAVMRAKLRTIEPYHRFAGILFKTAADPASPLNPFSDESLPTRRESVALFADVAARSRIDAASQFGAELPHLLWLYHMGVLLFWIHDTSPARRRTQRLVDATVPLISKIVGLAGLPVLRPVTRRVLDFLREFRDERGLPSTAGA